MIAMRHKLCLMVAVVFLTSCTALHPPQPQMPPRYSVTPGESITVKGNQNIYAIAQAYHVPMREVIVLNNLQPPFTLRPGQQLVLPAGGGSSESSSRIYGPYGANSYGPATSGGSYGTGSGATAPAPASALSPAVETETLAPIEVAPVASSPSNINHKSQGAVESLNAPSQAQAAVVTTASQPQNLRVPSATSPQGTPTPAPVPSPAPAAASVTSTASTAAAETPAQESGASIKMIWPVQGPVLSTFGSKGQGLNNDGVNIGAPKGTPVVAAAGGTVVYAGSEMKGFGNLVLIRHEGGWVTAYAHLDRLLVAKDAVVGQGDMIGTVGKTGNVPTPQLHFETRSAGKPVDPSGIIKTP